MSIPYDYEIVRVDPAARVMEVSYSAEGHPTLLISARLPYAGEDVEAVVEQFSPVAYWLSASAPVDVPELRRGRVAPGVVEPEPVTLESAKRNKLADIAEWRWKRETGGVRFGRTRIATDRESQSMLANAVASISRVGTVDWKNADGTWAQLDGPALEAVATVVAKHVQECFTLERLLGELVLAATTIEEVQAIAPNELYPL